MHDVCFFEGTVKGAKFEYFLRRCVIPILKPFNWVNSHSFVIMDNASIHHVQGVIDIIENPKGARLLFFHTVFTGSKPL